MKETIKEPVQTGRGLEDISHYFLSEKEEKEPQPKDEAGVARKSLFLLGVSSKEGRAVLASNLACEWSLNHKEVELIEEEARLANAHFLLGESSGLIALASWKGGWAWDSGKAEWRIWNIGLEGTLKIISDSTIAPIVIVVLEEGTKNLIQAYAEIRKALSVRPDAVFYAVRYSNQPAEKSQQAFDFFQRTARKFLNIEIRDGGQMVKDLHLAKSILRRYPIVLFSEEGIPAKTTLKNLAQTLTHGRS